MIYTKEEVRKIKENCEAWGNNCGGCETCSQVFGKTPEYDFQETHALCVTIEQLQQQVTELLEPAKALLHALDNKPGDDLGQRAFADALIALRAAVQKQARSEIE